MTVLRFFTLSPMATRAPSGLLFPCPQDAELVLHALVQVLGALLASLTKLRRITLWIPEFEEAPAVIFSLPDLEFLCFEGCSNLTSFNAGAGLTRLTELNLVDCRLEKLPCLAGATRLEELFICWIVDIAGLRYKDFVELILQLPSLRDKDPHQFCDKVYVNSHASPRVRRCARHIWECSERS